MIFTELTRDEFDKFSRNHQNRCYLQSLAVASLRKRNGWEPLFVGVKEGDNIIGATMLLSKKQKIKYEFYALRGPLLDFQNTELVTFFFTSLKEYIKKHNGYMLRIDPYIEAISRDRDGNPTDEFDNQYIKDKLKKIGFKEVMAEKLEDTTQAKFMYVIDLKDTLDKVMKDMDSKTRQMIRKNEKTGITIRVGSKKDISTFAEIMRQTSDRRGFYNRGEKFYQDMYECLIEDDMISLVFAELDINLARQKIRDEQKEIAKTRKLRDEQRKKGMCNEERSKKKEQEEETTLNKLIEKEKELDVMEQKYGSKITLGGILYIMYEGEIDALFGGSYEKFKEYQPFYTIHYEMLKYAVQNKYNRYNFYAINNNLDKDAPQYGNYLFKRGFGGHVMELLGEFILPIDKKVYNLHKTISNIKKKIRH